MEEGVHQDSKLDASSSGESGHYGSSASSDEHSASSDV